MKLSVGELRNLSACKFGVDAFLEFFDADEVELEWTPLHYFMVPAQYFDYIKWLSEEGLLPRLSFHGLQAYGVDSERRYLDFAQIPSSNFNSAYMPRSTFEMADVRHSSFMGANLSVSSFAGCRANRADFTEALLNDSSMERFDARLAVFRGADLSGVCGDSADFSYAKCGETRWNGSYLYQSSFRSASLADAGMADSSFQEVIFDRIYGRGVSFDRSRVERCSFVGSGLGKSSFIDARIEMSRFIGCDMAYVNMSKCEARGTVMHNTSFRYANVSGADLRDSVITNCNFNDSLLEHVDFGNTIISGCNFEGADLSRADFRGARFDSNININDLAARGAIVENKKGEPI